MARLCQSCSMPLDKDPGHGGTNADGSHSDLYCSLCYADGQFRNPEIQTASQMQDFCIARLEEQGMPKVMAWLFTRSIPRLQRWRTIS